ncbi:MAG: YcaO-like family protein [Pseudomonadota bacterium]
MNMMVGDTGAFWHRSSIAELVLQRPALALQKHFFAGTHRRSCPEVALTALTPDLATFGITRVARLTGLDRLGVEVFTAFRPNSRGLTTAQGKGATRSAARLSAVMEAIECHVAEEPGPAPVHGTLDDMVGRFGARRIEPPASRAGQARRIDWTWATDLLSGGDVLVPYDHVHTSLLLGGRATRLWRDVTTNGLASGANLVEALIHGICEVIERADTAAFAETFRPQDALDPGRFDWPEIAALAAQADARGFAIRAWETTGPLGVPSFVACLADLTDATMPPGYGAGCHLSPRVALARALHEAAQSRLTRISGARDDLSDDCYDARERLRARHFTSASTACAPGSTALRDLSGPCLVGDLGVLLDRLAAAGVGRVLAVDLADDPRFRVVKLVVPGLEATLRRAQAATKPTTRERPDHGMPAWQGMGGIAR